jgi:hypothetical protein
MYRENDSIALNAVLHAKDAVGTNITFVHLQCDALAQKTEKRKVEFLLAMMYMIISFSRVLILRTSMFASLLLWYVTCTSQSQMLLVFQTNTTP